MRRVLTITIGFVLLMGVTSHDLGAAPPDLGWTVKIRTDGFAAEVLTSDGIPLKLEPITFNAGLDEPVLKLILTAPGSLDVPWPRTMPERIKQIGDELFTVLDDGRLLVAPLATLDWKFVDVADVNAVTAMQ